MNETATLIAEARDVGIRFEFDGERLCVYARQRAPQALVDRLRAARPQLEPLLRAERDLLQHARMLDRLVDGMVPDPTTASAFITASRDLNGAFLEDPPDRIQAFTSAWKEALPTRSAPGFLAERPAEVVVRELERAHQRLGRILSEFPNVHRPTWDEYEPLERARRTEAETGDPDRGLAALAEWERAVLDLLNPPGRESQP